MISSTPAVSYWTESALSSTAPILKRAQGLDARANAPAADLETSCRSHHRTSAKSIKSSCNPCVNYQSESGCHRTCRRDHTQPEIGSKAWWELREDLKRCIEHFSRQTTIEPLAYLGMGRGFTLPTRDSGEPLVDYCYSAFTTAGCSARSCRRYHLLPANGCSEWALLKNKLLSYVKDTLIWAPDIDYSSEVKDRGVTTSHTLDSISASAFPRIPCFWFYTEEGCD